MVECGGLENRFTGNPGDEGSNPSSSARKLKALANARAFSFSGSCAIALGIEAVLSMNNHFFEYNLGK